jgi:hypothetical protein
MEAWLFQVPSDQVKSSPSPVRERVGVRAPLSPSAMSLTPHPPFGHPLPAGRGGIAGIWLHSVTTGVEQRHLL